MREEPRWREVAKEDAKKKIFENFIVARVARYAPNDLDPI